MKVKELLHHLEKMDPESDVFLEYETYNYWRDRALIEIKGIHDGVDVKWNSYLREHITAEKRTGSGDPIKIENAIILNWEEEENYD